MKSPPIYTVITDDALQLKVKRSRRNRKSEVSVLPCIKAGL